MRLPPLVPATLVARYKRFLCDVTLDSGETITAHCPNPGAMLGLLTPGARIWLTDHRGAGRKLDHSWTLTEATFPGVGREIVGVDTNLPNALAEEAIRAGRVPALAGYANLRREVRYGVNSRIDLLLETEGRPRCWVEVKNVHLMRRAGVAEFPDCVTKRGAKHLVELSDRVAAGERAVMLFVIQMRAESFDLARDIDPGYAKAFAAARAAGVEAMAWRCAVSTDEIFMEAPVPVLA